MNCRHAAAVILLALPAVSPAQAPPAAPAAVARPPADPVLVAHLRAWQQVMGQAKTFYAECTKVQRNTNRKTEEVYKGQIACMKPGLARVRMEQQPPPGERPDPNACETYICTAQAVYLYSTSDRLLTEFRFVPGQPPRNLLLEVMSGGLTAQAALDRFDMKVLQEDQYFVWIKIDPRLPDDMADFATMQLVLSKPNPGAPGYLPRKIVITKDHLNQDIEEWSFPNPAIDNMSVTLDWFKKQSLPAGWKEKVELPPPAGRPRPAPVAPAGRVPAPGVPAAGAGLPPR